MKKILSAALTVCLATFVNAADVAVFPPTLTNLTASQGDVIGMVMTQQYSRFSKKSVIGPVESGPVLAEAGNKATDAALKLGVTEYVMISAVALQTKILIYATLSDKNGVELFNTSMTAASLDDIENVCDRMSRSLVTRQNTDETIEIGNVTQEETREENRVSVEKIAGIKTAYVYPMSTGEMEPMMSLGYSMKFEVKRALIDFAVQGLFPTNFGTYNDNVRRYGGISIEMGGNYYLNEERYASPYIGGGVSPRLLFIPGAFGMTAYAQFGVMFMRVWSTRLYAELRLAQNLLPLTYTDYDYNSTTYESSTRSHSYTPTEIGLSLGIGW